ncbi:hypothetical protein L9G15_21965, partial [Shewanella sp. A3A]|nr:hypothetical protein [Shewanella ferrihydritica]
MKRLLRSHNDIASKEIENLIASDQDPNIVRMYGFEQDNDFVYISLESSSHIIVANCGDSRAVLCRGKQPVPLSVDHKPNRE